VTKIDAFPSRYLFLIKNVGQVSSEDLFLSGWILISAPEGKLTRFSNYWE